MARLPTPGGDSGNWGTILNEFLEVSHQSDGTLKNLPSHLVVATDGTGDYETISEALAAVSSGDTIFIKNGTYAGGFNIQVAGITLAGESRDNVIIQSPEDTTPAIRISAAHVTIRDLKVDGRRDLKGPGQTDTNSHSGIRIQSEYATIQNVWLFETYGYGISGNAAHYGKILNCLVENRATNGDDPVSGFFAYGVYAQGTRGWRVIGNTITGWSQGIGFWWGTHESIAAFNHVINNFGYITESPGSGGTRSAIEDYGASEAGHGNNLWLGNLVDGSTSCCFEIAQGVKGSQVVGNVIRNWNKFGDNTGSPFQIVDGGETQRTSDITFRDNRIYGSDAVGGSAYVKGRNVQISGNYFIDMPLVSTCALVCEGAITSGLHIEGNHFFNVSGAIRLDGGIADGAQILNNTVNQQSADGLAAFEIRSGGVHNISNNTIISDKGRGIAVTSAAGDHHRLQGNTIITGQFAMAINRGRNIISNNYMVQTSSNSLNAFALTGADCVGNVCRGNFISGAVRRLAIGGGAEYNLIEDSYFGDGADNLVGGPNNRTDWRHDNASSIAVSAAFKSLGGQTVGTSQVTVAHGIGYTPSQVTVTMTSDGRVWKSAASDDTNIYLTADAADRTAEVFVR